MFCFNYQHHSQFKSYLMKKLSLFSDNKSLSLSRTRIDFQDLHQPTSDLNSSRSTLQFSPIRTLTNSLKQKYEQHSFVSEDRNSVQHKFLQTLHHQIRVQEKKRQTKPILIPALQQQQFTPLQQSQLKLGKQLVNRFTLFFQYDDEKSTLSDCKETTNQYLNINQPLIPCAIQQLDKQIIQTMNQFQNPFLNVGVLQDLGFSYFVVNNIVFFQDITRCTKMLPINSPNKVLFKDRVLEIVSGRFKSSALRQQERDHLLIVSHPKQICFYRYVIVERHLQVYNLGIYIRTGCNVKNIAVTKSGRIFYVDKQGKLLQINEDIVSKWRKPFSNKRFYLQNIKYNNSSSYYKVWQKLKKQSFPSAIDYFSIVTKKAFKSIYNSFRHKSSLRVLSLVINEDIQMISMLIDKGWQRQLHCFSLANSSLKDLISLDQEQLFSKIGKKQFIKNKISIVNLAPVQCNYDQNSNLVASLSNGIRIWLRVSKQFVKITRIIMAPRISVHHNYDYSHPYQPLILQSTSKSTNLLLKAQSKRNITMMTFEENKNSFHQTYLLDKLSMFSYQTITKIDWEIALQEENFCYIGVIPDCHLLNYQKNTIIQLQKSALNKGMKFNELNELARQVHYPPQTFYFINSVGIEIQMKMRPIDILFSIMFSERIPISYCHRVFISMVQASCLHPSEIMAMFMQILFDRSGQYFIQNTFSERLIAASDFDTQKQSLYLRADIMNPRTIRIPYSQIPTPTKKRIAQIIRQFEKMINYPTSIFQKMIKKSMKKDSPIYSQQKYYEESKDYKQEGILLYLSRLLRPLWHLRLQQIHLHAGCFKHILDNLQYILNEIVKNPIGINVETKLSFGLNQTVLGFIKRVFQMVEFCRVFSVLPEIQFCQSLYQTPRYYQKYIFDSVVKNFKVQNLKAQALLIPYFTSSRIRLVQEYYRQFQKCQSIDQVITKINKYKKIPSYVHLYLNKYKQLPNHVIVSYDDLLAADQPQTLGHKISTLQQQIKNIKINLVQQPNSHSTQQVFQDKQHRLKILNIQAALVQECISKRIQLSIDVLTQLQKEEYPQEQLRLLIFHLQNPFTDALYMTNFNSNIMSEVITALFPKQKQVTKDEKLLTLKKLLKYTYAFQEIDGLTNAIIQILFQILFSQKKVSDHIQGLLKNQPNKEAQCQIYWIGSTLVSWGYSIQRVYLELRNRVQMIPHCIKKEQFSMKCRSDIICRLISYLLFTKDAYPSEIKQAEDEVQTSIDCLFNYEMITTQEYNSLIYYLGQNCKKNSLKTYY